MIALEDVDFAGKGLVRPECVLATKAGDLFAGDWRGGVAHIRPDGRQALYVGRTADIEEGLRPNGIALEPDGSFLLANLGTDVGGAWRLNRDGQVRPVLAELDGAPLPPSNFVTRDAAGRIWLTISSRLKPRTLDFRPEAASGYVVLLDRKGARIVADGLGFTNECAVDPSGHHLYVIETCGRRLSRFPVRADGDLGPKEVVATFGKSGFPDGFAFDAEGAAWIAFVVSNELIRVDRDGTSEVVLADKDDAHVAAAERAYETGSGLKPFIDATPAQVLKSISSVAFGGPDLRTVHMGCLGGDRIARLAVPTAGHPPVHWHYRA